MSFHGLNKPRKKKGKPTSYLNLNPNRIGCQNREIITGPILMRGQSGKKTNDPNDRSAYFFAFGGIKVQGVIFESGLNFRGGGEERQPTTRIERGNKGSHFPGLKGGWQEEGNLQYKGSLLKWSTEAGDGERTAPKGLSGGSHSWESSLIGGEGRKGTKCNALSLRCAGNVQARRSVWEEKKKPPYRGQKKK